MSVHSINGSLRVSVAFFYSLTDSSPHSAGQLTWAELVEILENSPRVGSLTRADYHAANSDARARDKNGPAWMPCKLNVNGGRRAADVTEVSALALDFDSGVAFDAIADKLREYEWVAHSTHSHWPQAPRFRVVLPLAHAIKPSELRGLFDHVNGWLGDTADVACGHDPARVFLLPSCPADALEDHFTQTNPGKFLDPACVQALEVHPAQPTASDVPAHVPTANGSAPDFNRGYPDGKRTGELTKRAGWCIGRGMSIEKTTERCLAWSRRNTPPLDEGKVRDTCESIARTHAQRINQIELDTNAKLDVLNEKFAFVTKHAQIYRLEYADFIHTAAFRAQFANVPVQAEIDGRLQCRSLADAWIHWPQRRQHRDVVYEPGKSPITGDGINLWRAWGCAPAAGDVSPWLAFLNYVFDGDVDHRKWFEQWIAYPLQHPGTKMNTAVVFWSSRQGVGKTLVGETIGKIYGSDNFKTISAAELHGAFNGWAKSCQFVLGEENASADHRADSNRLKHLITGETIAVNEKHQPMMHMKNCMNFFFTSNHPDAFFLEQHDRRFFVWELTGDRLSDSFYADFVDWRDNRNGLSHLMQYLTSLDLAGFNPKAAAPVTPAKLAMVDTSKSDLERWLTEMRDDPAVAAATMGKEIVSLEQLVRHYNAEGTGRVNTTSVGKAMQRLGLGCRRRIAVPSGKRPWLYPLCRPEFWEPQDNPAWAAENAKLPKIHSLALAA